MKSSVVISYYKNLAALKLLLQALSKQSSVPLEVIVAEDDNDEATRKYLESKGHSYAFDLVHLHQEVNDGFRKNQMLNRAYRAARSNVIAFLDGDCIPHSKWLENHERHVQPGSPVFGRRVMLGPTLTDRLQVSQNLNILNYFNLMFSRSKRLKYALYIPFLSVKKRGGMWGCNWSVYRTDLQAIDGFDEQYIRAGIGEDVDVEWRMNTKGIFFRSVRHHCLVYHLHHESHYDATDVAINNEILAKKQAQYADL